MTDIVIQKGDTFSRVERLSLETLPFIYKAITAITKASPVAITSAGHGLTADWRVAVVSAGGMRQINAKNFPPRATDFHKAIITSSSIIALNDVNSADYTTYTSGGSLVYYTPRSLASCTARLQIRATATAADPALVSLTSPSGGIVLDDTAHTITITIAATVTAAYTFYTGVYDLELVTGDATPVVTKLLSGNVTVLDEVTR